MRNILFLSGILLLNSCAEENNKTKIVERPESVLFLRVDYLTTVFEAGKELQTTGEVTSFYDSIPIKVDYMSPGDVGFITLRYQPLNDTIFFGDLIWMGKGKVFYPRTFAPANSYALLSTSSAQPPDSSFQVLFNDLHTKPNYKAIWNSISKLEIVSTYLKSKKKIGVFIYRPSQGMGNPADWDWYVVMNKY